MANLCCFDMWVKGEKNNILAFYEAIQQKGNIYIGRGAEADISFFDDNKASILGDCKWSVYSALIENAISMKNYPKEWYIKRNIIDVEIITLIEATQKWNLEIEVYSEESGCCFQEYYHILNGEIKEEECVDWENYWVDEFKTKSEAEEALGMKIDDYEWKCAKENDGYFCRGGFGEWNFHL